MGEFLSTRVYYIVVGPNNLILLHFVLHLLLVSRRLTVLYYTTSHAFWLQDRDWLSEPEHLHTTGMIFDTDTVFSDTSFETLSKHSTFELLDDSEKVVYADVVKPKRRDLVEEAGDKEDEEEEEDEEEVDEETKAKVAT